MAKWGRNMIRLAQLRDVPELLAIYAPYIQKTCITFEYEAPTIEEFTERFRRITAKYPWIVWEEDGKILGYAYADAAFSRAAYAWDADLSIYLDMNARGRGIGGKLYDDLEGRLARMGYHTLYAIITGENAASARFHERRGYRLEGTLHQTGWKFGAWHDVFWYAKRVRPALDPGAAPDGEAREAHE